MKVETLRMGIGRKAGRILALARTKAGGGSEQYGRGKTTTGAWSAEWLTIERLIGGVFILNRNHGRQMATVGLLEPSVWPFVLLDYGSATLRCKI